MATVLAAVSLTSCLACSSKKPIVVVTEAGNYSVDAAAAPSTIVKQDNWQFSLPGTDWNKDTLCVSSNCPIIYNNKIYNSKVVLSVEDSTNTYSEYIILSLRDLRGMGATITSSKQVSVNGNQFVLVESSDKVQTYWTWLTLINHKGYDFSCGGPTMDNTQHDLCFGIANSFKIN
jgi:hypothetical protein